jgi:peptidoglycan/xylan/chitin deacetylase (PgdA/CDA1 family)
VTLQIQTNRVPQSGDPPIEQLSETLGVPDVTFTGAMKKRARRVVARTLKASGLLHLAGASRWRTDRLVVLGYHGISLEDEHEFDAELFMSAAVFAKRMEQLHRSRAAVLPLTEAMTRLWAGTLPPRAVVLTFDDGFFDFHQVALPVLRRHGFPATVYQTTYYSDYQEPVCHLAWRYILWKGRTAQLNLAPITGEDRRFDLSIAQIRTQVFLLINKYADQQELTGRERNDLAAKIAAEIGVDFDAIRRKRLLGLMTPDDVRDVSRHDIAVELHTHRHRTPADQQLFLREIDDNRSWIERVTGRRPVHFCYPSGRWQPIFFPWLEERGIASATTCELGLATRNAPKYLVPRLIDTMAMNPVEFDAYIAGPLTAMHTQPVAR